MNLELWSKPLLFFPCQVCNLLLHEFRSRTKFSFHHCSASSRILRFKCPLGHGLAGAQNLTNWISVGIGWGISVGLASKPSKNMQSTAAPRKQHQNLVWNWCPVFIIWTWIIYIYIFIGGIGFGWSPIGCAGFIMFHELLQSSRQLLTTPFIQ